MVLTDHWGPYDFTWRTRAAPMGMPLRYEYHILVKSQFSCICRWGKFGRIARRGVCGLCSNYLLSLAFWRAVLYRERTPLLEMVGLDFRSPTRPDPFEVWISYSRQIWVFSCIYRQGKFGQILRWGVCSKYFFPMRSLQFCVRRTDTFVRILIRCRKPGDDVSTFQCTPFSVICTV